MRKWPYTAAMHGGRRWTGDNKKQIIHWQWSDMSYGVAATPPPGGWYLPELGGRSNELGVFNPKPPTIRALVQVCIIAITVG